MGYERITKIDNKSNLAVGIKDVFVKENDELAEYMTCYGDGEKWQLLKNPTGETVTVSFNTDGGSGTFPSQTVTIGQAITEPQDVPSKSNAFFENWYLGDEPYDWNYKPVSNITLTAHYLEYEEIEYIQSTGTQYIDTGIVPNSGSRMALDIAFTDTTINNRSGWGSSGSQEAFGVGIKNSSESTFFMICSSNSTYVNFGSKDTSRHLFDISNAALKFDGVSYGTGTIGNTATSGQTIYLGSYHAEWETTAIFGKQKIYSCKIWDNDTLIRDFQPIKITSTGEYCLLDTVENKAYRNSGTGKFAGKRDEPLRLAYLESDGNQYIITGVSPYKTKCQVTAQIHTTPTKNGYVLAGWNANDNRYYPLSYHKSNNDFRCADRSNNYFVIGSSDNNIHTVIYNDENNKVYFDGTQKATVSDLTEQVSGKVHLFCNGGGDSPADFLPCRIYEVIFTNKITNQVISHLVPMLDVDNTPCMYDTVTETFYYNAGTGTFNYGELT